MVGVGDEAPVTGWPTAADQLPVIPSPRRGGMERFGTSRAGSINASVRPKGTMTHNELAPGRDRSVSSRFAETAELAVSERVEDEGEQSPRGGDGRDALPATLGDAFFLCPEERGRALPLHGLDHHPADEATALLGDLAAMDRRGPTLDALA